MLQVDVLCDHVVVHVRVLPASEDLRLVHVVITRSHDNCLRRVPVGAVKDELGTGGQVAAPGGAGHVVDHLPIAQIRCSVAAVDCVFDTLASIERIHAGFTRRLGAAVIITAVAEDVDSAVDTVGVSEVSVCVAHETWFVTVTAVVVNTRDVSRHRGAICPNTVVRVASLAVSPVGRRPSRRVENRAVSSRIFAHVRGDRFGPVARNVF